MHQPNTSKASCHFCHTDLVYLPPLLLLSLTFLARQGLPLLGRAERQVSLSRKAHLILLRMLWSGCRTLIARFSA